MSVTRGDKRGFRAARSRRRFLFLCIAGLAIAGAGAAAYPSLRVRQLVARLRGCEHEAAVPREQLVALLGDQAVPFFGRLLEAPEPAARLQAVEVLLERRGPCGLGQLLPMMGDYHARIRQRIVEAASQWETPEAYALLLAAAADGDLWVRQAAVTGLAGRARRRGDRSPQTLAALARAVEDTDLTIASSAMGTMRALARQDFGFRVASAPEARRAALVRWRKWWRRSALRPQEAAALPAPLAVRRSAPAPEFAVVDIDGRRWSKRALAGRPVLLHFFGTWCGACEEEMQHLQALSERRPDVALLALGVAEKGPDGLRRYAARHRLSFPLALTPEPLSRALGDIHEVPVTFLIDARGRIRRRFDGDRDLNTFLAALRAVTTPGERPGGPAAGAPPALLAVPWVGRKASRLTG